MIIKKMTKQYVSSVAILANKLWPNAQVDELTNEFSEMLESEKEIVIICIINTSVIGFAHFALRFDYVEGTTTSPVAYVEGIFIEEDYRKMGYAKEIFEEGIYWAKEMNCIELGSDCDIKNIISQDFHKKIGFKEVSRVVCFSKKI